LAAWMTASIVAIQMRHEDLQLQYGTKEIFPKLLVNDIKIKDQDVIYKDQKVLGMGYIPRSDSFTFKVKYGTLQEWKNNLGADLRTKRLILKVTPSHKARPSDWKHDQGLIRSFKDLGYPNKTKTQNYHSSEL